MKIHRIEIENLNSLYGEQIIDFDEHLSGAPLFLIMGRTGAGKTTILDAICLTLFGTTPRVRDESSHFAASRPAERMMSKGTAHCRALLEFSLVDDQGRRERYRAEWRCDRTYKSPTGNVKDPHRSLRKFQNGSWDHEPLASGSRKKDYEEAFDDLLGGMTEESFLRSTLLAQGQFSAFLKADESEKATILERLTKTNEYRRIGRRAGTVMRHKRDAIEDIEKHLKKLPDIDEQALQGMAERLRELATLEESKKVDLQASRQRAQWVKDFQGFTNAHQKASERYKVAKGVKEEASADFERLAIAKRALPTRPLLDTINDKEKQHSELQEAIPDLKENLEKAAKTLKETSASTAVCEKTHKQVQAALDSIAPEIKKAREARIRRDEAKKNVSAAEKEEGKAQENLEQAEKAQEKAAKQVDAARETHKKAEEDLETLGQSTELVEKLSGLESDLRRIDEKESSLETKRQEHQDLEKKLEEIADKQEKKKALLKKNRETLQPLKGAAKEARSALKELLGEAPDAASGRALIMEKQEQLAARQKALEKLGELGAKRQTQRKKQITTQKELTELVGGQKSLKKQKEAQQQLVQTRQETVDAARQTLTHLQQALALSDKRRNLEPGTACPLCGSEDHPFLGAGDHHQVDDQLEEDRAQQQQKIVRAKEELEESRQEVQETDQKLARLLERQIALKKTLSELSEELQGLDEEVEEAITAADLESTPWEELSADVNAALETTASEKERLSTAWNQLEEAVKNAEQTQQFLSEAKKELDKLTGDLEKLDVERTQLGESKVQLSQNIETLTEEISAQRKELVQALEQVGIAIEKDLATALEQARERRDEVQAVQKALHQAKSKLEKANSAAQRAANTIEQATRGLEESKQKTESLRQELASRTKAAQDFLDGQDPDKLEEAHKQAIEEAHQKYEEARKAQH